MATLADSPKVEAKPREQPEDIVSPFEVVYSAVFVVGVILAGASAWQVLVAKGSNRESKIIVAFLIAALLFQYFRMYYHLHQFDHARPSFIGELKGWGRTLDRVMRLLLAATLVLVHEHHFQEYLLRGDGWVLGSFTRWVFESVSLQSDISDVAPAAMKLITLFSLALLAAFWMLIIWDINICWHYRTKANDSELASLRKFYYVGDRDTFDGYFLTKKFRERCLGWVSALAMVTFAAYPSQILLLFAALFFLGFALLAASNSGNKVLSVFLTPFQVLGHYFSQRGAGH